MNRHHSHRPTFKQLILTMGFCLSILSAVTLCADRVIRATDEREATARQEAGVLEESP